MNLILKKESPNITRYKLKKEYKDLLMSIEALPGVHVQSTNLDNSFKRIRSGWNGCLIFLHIEECTQEGLFFLARCMDKRYWEWGHKWRIQLEVGDSIYPNGDRPISYMIFRPFIDGDTEEDIINECKSLLSNMNYHFNHDNFMKCFNMNRKEYHLVDEVAYEREIRLKEIGI